jgi:hypothetical protein
MNVIPAKAGMTVYGNGVGCRVRSSGRARDGDTSPAPPSAHGVRAARHPRSAIMSAPSRRVPRRVVLAAAAAALAALAPTPAAAQGACADATLEAYIAPGFACRIGDWAFESFLYLNFAELTDGVDGRANDAVDVIVRPFDAVDALGRRTFGFAFDGFETSLAVNGVSRGGEQATVQADLLFSARALTPGAGLLAAAVDLSAALVATQPAGHFVVSSTSGQIGDVFGASPCVLGIAEAFGRTESTRVSQEGDCFGELPLTADVLVGNISFLNRSEPGTEPLFATASGAVERVTFITTQAVPEPATVALLAPALVAGGVVMRRRADGRVRSSRPSS